MIHDPRRFSLIKDLLQTTKKFFNCDYNNSFADEADTDNDDELHVAFKVCNTDSEEGLTWAEVEKCEDQYCMSMGIPNCPTKDEFDQADSNGDGILVISEWLSSS